MVSKDEFDKFLTKFDPTDDKIHFAFLFASPLVLQSSRRVKLMPLLNYSRELDKIVDSMERTNYKMNV